ncbi:TetR/AcrR family transcriptional regulator C-terminal domain-containing protein [Herbidospora cretacea]|uniref:TetR/AcrR family transcriptional regulator C-terminal domain-containing protein n=1 Tax=Herbidospora cretacea TaxID=28444 RepID=UPI0007731B77|nr:TetR/AcrR family transcriptional regulator C-terminal domain-containing protein [Herbidospora cretacea]
MTDRPLYLRIADEIAADIRSGRLPEGRPAPSTRQIVRDRGVAMATATKVIGTLRDQGLVETVPGRGTVVRRRGAAPRPSRSRLSAAEIVEAAVEIADAEGLALVTMRRVAVSLGASTMALYRHVPNRNDLTLRMADHVFTGARLPDIRLADWRRRLEVAARLFWAVFSRHPWAAEIFSLSRPQLLPNVLPIAEWSFATLHAMGFSAHDMLCTHINLFGQVRGMALVRLAEARAEEDTGMSADDWMRVRGGDLGRWASDHPGVGHVVQEEFDFDLDTIFEFGLQRLLDGVAAHHRALGL